MSRRHAIRKIHSHAPANEFNEWRLERSPINHDKYKIVNDRRGSIAIANADEWAALFILVTELGDLYSLDDLGDNEIDEIKRLLEERKRERGS